MRAGRLITIEGIDGAGKTTLARALEAALRERGIEVQLLREPGGVSVAERVRELVKDPELRIGSRAEALLYAAARAQLVEETIEPLLERGVWVLLDRFVDSSLAYQGGGRGLGIDAVAEVNHFATGALRPDRTLLLAVDAPLGRARSEARPDLPDRLEREEDDFFRAVASTYSELAANDRARIRVVDGSQSPELVLAQALEEISDLL